MATLSVSDTKDIHRDIAGGISVAVMQPDVQKLETIKDALKFESGVVIQESFGANDQPRISIRGSETQSNPQRRGLYLLQNGIPVNLVDGTFIISIMNPALAESIEVYKGANTLRFGSASLGGAINFNSHTGRWTQGIRLKVGGGSFGYASMSALAGKSREYLMLLFLFKEVDKRAFANITKTKTSMFQGTLDIDFIKNRQ